METTIETATLAELAKMLGSATFVDKRKNGEHRLKWYPIPEAFNGFRDRFISRFTELGYVAERYSANSMIVRLPTATYRDLVASRAFRQPPKTKPNHMDITVADLMNFNVVAYRVGAMATEIHHRLAELGATTKAKRLEVIRTMVGETDVFHGTIGQMVYTKLMAIVHDGIK